MLRSFKVLITASLAFSSVSCGKWATAGHESVITPPIPEYPVVANDVFALNSPKSRTSYRGSMPIFNDATQPQLIADILTASIDSRAAWAEMKKFELESDYVQLYGDNGQAPLQLSLMKDGLQAFELEALSKNPISQAAKIANAETWIDREVTALNLTPQKRASFDASWAEYCEAKVIELATHPLLAQNNFKSVPQPQALCVAHYKTLGLFQGPSCTGSAGDYFKCLWLEGVEKTRWFTSPLEASDPSLAAKKAEKRAMLEDLLTDANYASTRGVYGFKEGSFSPTVSAGLKKLYVDKKEAFLGIALDQKNDASCVKVVASVGSQNLCKVFSLAPEARSPRQIITVVEGVKVDDNIFARLPAPEAPRTVTTQQVIQYLGERNKAEPSEGDRLFDELADGSTLSSPSFANISFKNLLPQVRSLLGPEFYGTFSAADELERTRKSDAIAFLDEKIQASQKRWLELNDVITKTTDEGITAANAGDVSLAFVQYVMNFEQYGNLLRVDFSIKEHEDTVARGCLDLTSNSSVTCPADLPLKSGLRLIEAVVKRSPDGGKLEFALPLTDVDNIGLGYKARAEEGRKPDFFSDFQAADLEGKTLRFELYRNRLLDSLDIMTGKSFIDLNGVRQYEGGVSMWEQAE